MTCKDNCLHYEVCLTAFSSKGMYLGDDAEEMECFKNKADFVEVVRCKECACFVPKHIRLADGTTRPYTDEEKKLPCGVTSEVGINVGSYCLRKSYWKENSIPVWVQADDFCSYGERKDAQ